MTRAIGETTGEGYLNFCKKNKIEPSIVDLEDGGRGLFLGPASAPKTLLWFHGALITPDFLVSWLTDFGTGGGYNLGAAPSHFAFLHDLVKRAKLNGSDVRVMLLEYGMTISNPRNKNDRGAS